jgi:hypothetical protein
MDHIDTGGEGPAPASFNHIMNDALAAFEQRFDGTVAAIAHPALQVSPDRLVFHEGAVANALYTSVDDDVTDDAHSFSSTLMTREPVQREVDQRSTERT